MQEKHSSWANPQKAEAYHPKNQIGAQHNGEAKLSTSRGVPVRV